MGFFQELKEDLSQAVNELVPDEAETAASAVEEAEAPVSEEDIFAAAEASMGIEHTPDLEDMIAASEEMDRAMDDLKSEIDSTPERVITPPEPQAEPEI